MSEHVNGQVLTADTFFAKPFERRYRTIELPGGRKVRIQNLTDREKTAYETAMLDEERGRMRKEYRIALICSCLVDAAGKRLFGDYREKLDQFRDMDGAETQLLYDACWDHCGMGGTAAKALTERFAEASA